MLFEYSLLKRRDAWKGIEGTSKEAAMQGYIDLTTEIKADWDQ